MRSMIRIIAAAAVAILVLGSCIRSSDIHIETITDVRMHGTSGVTMDIEVSNTSARNVSLKSMDITISYDGTQIANYTLVDPVRIPKRSTEIVSVRFKSRMDNPFAFLPMLTAIQNNSYADSLLTVSGTLRGKVGAASKKLTIKETPVTEIISNFDKLNYW